MELHLCPVARQCSEEKGAVNLILSSSNITGLGFCKVMAIRICIYSLSSSMEAAVSFHPERIHVMCFETAL